MKDRLGHDFSAVRVHSGPAAAICADNLGAAAFTVGSHVAFGAGQFAPASRVGAALLAHELAHVVQQSSVHGSPTPEEVRVGPTDDEHE